MTGVLLLRSCKPFYYCYFSFRYKAIYSIPNTNLLPVFGFTKVLVDVFGIFNDILVPWKTRRKRFTNFEITEFGAGFLPTKTGKLQIF